MQKNKTKKLRNIKNKEIKQFKLKTQEKIKEIKDKLKRFTKKKESKLKYNIKDLEKQKKKPKKRNIKKTRKKTNKKTDKKTRKKTDKKRYAGGDPNDYDNHENSQGLIELEDYIDMTQNQVILNNNNDDYSVCQSNNLHNVEDSLETLINIINDVETNVKDVIQYKFNEVIGKYHMSTDRIELEIEAEAWFSSFCTIFEYQRYSLQDIEQAIIYMRDYIEPNSNAYYDFTIDSQCPPSIQKLFKDYRFKIITGYFTKASITYSTYLLNSYTWKKNPYVNVSLKQYGTTDYLYLNNLMCILSIANKAINSTMYELWEQFMVGTPHNNGSYVHSGGNIFFIFAGILCYIKYQEEVEEEDYMPDKYYKMNAIYQEIIDNDNYKNFIEELDDLFADPQFNKAVKTILSGMSDIDFTYMSDNPDCFNHKNKFFNPTVKNLNALSAGVLRKILSEELQIGTRDTYSALFPFKGNYDDSWPTFKMYATSRITQSNIDKINRLGDIRDKYGYRQTSSYIDPINIYINRIKQGFYPFNKDTVPPEDVDEYKTKFGECIDLVIGSSHNDIFNHKWDQFKKGYYYSINNLYEELEFIRENSYDDKSDKRLLRMYFLQKLARSKYSNIFNMILVCISEQLHRDFDGDLIGYPTTHRYDQDASLKFAKENYKEIKISEEDMVEISEEQYYGNENESNENESNENNENNNGNMSNGNESNENENKNKNRGNMSNVNNNGNNGNNESNENESNENNGNNGTMVH